MYPLRFEPLFQRYIWGGTRIKTMLDKPAGQGTCAESWEIVDHGIHQSIVKYGPLKGKTLREIVSRHGEDLLGKVWLERINDASVPANLIGRFPLLLKFLDANQHLSVQVHPDNQMAATLDPPDLGKTEAWYVMHADAGAKIFAGLKTGVSREQFKLAISNGTTEELLHSFSPKAGDCVFIRAGTLHAIGAGLVIAEIQQASNTTFRVFDWNRLGSDGLARDLHVEQSLAAIDFDLGPVRPVVPVDTENPKAKTIVSNSKFVMRKWTTDDPVELNDDQLHLLAVTTGNVSVAHDPGNQPLQIADTILIPASCTEVQVIPDGTAEFLDIVLPN